MTFTTRTWPDGLTIREVTGDEYEKFVRPAETKIFENCVNFFLESKLTGEDLAKSEVLRERWYTGPTRLRLGAFLNGSFAGWHFGRQDGSLIYSMTNSGVLPEFRRKKLYERMLESVILWTKDQGYHIVTSRHNPTNNAVIIPKLKKGFFISGTEMDEKVGLTVKLTYFHDEIARKVFAHRSGYILPDDDIKKSLLRIES